jgi:hypothetical protein
MSDVIRKIAGLEMKELTTDEAAAKVAWLDSHKA